MFPLRNRQKPVRPMLRHFAENKGCMYKYSLYGHYKSGQDSIVLPLTVEYVKGKFLTYTEQGIKHKLHVELNLNDSGSRDLYKPLGATIVFRLIRRTN